MSVDFLSNSTIFASIVCLSRSWRGGESPLLTLGISPEIVGQSLLFKSCQLIFKQNKTNKKIKPSLLTFSNPQSSFPRVASIYFSYSGFRLFLFLLCPVKIKHAGVLTRHQFPVYNIGAKLYFIFLCIFSHISYSTIWTAFITYSICCLWLNF